MQEMSGEMEVLGLVDFGSEGGSGRQAMGRPARGDGGGQSKLRVKSRPQPKPPHALPLPTKSKSSFCKKTPSYETDGTSQFGPGQKTHRVHHDDLGQVTRLLRAAVSSRVEQG